MRKVVVTFREHAIEDLAAKNVVFGVALAVTPGKSTVRVLTEAHHDAAPFNRIAVVDRIGQEIPAQFTR